MPVIVGTGGHVDHGKTLLVTALTGHGEDLDRWDEEKNRGLTIDIGFAFLDDGAGGKISFIDVPGHEDFVNNMVVGASGVDFGLLVIAADDGIMPQTREHLEIMHLFGIRDFLAAVTKIDIAGRERTDEVVRDVEEMFSGLPDCEQQGIFPVSAVTGDGIDELREYLVEFCSEFESVKPGDGYFRLPVDRVFTIKGFGTVVTGSLVSGNVAVGDDVEIVPHKRKVKVRGIELDDSRADQAVIGQRTALNLAGAEKEELKRGCQAAAPGTVGTAYMVNVSLEPALFLKNAVENRSELRFMSGTSSMPGILEILNGDAVVPGGTGYLAQVRLRDSVPLKCGDRFVLRSMSPEKTVAGGEVLELGTVKLSSSKKEAVSRLDRIYRGSMHDRIVEIYGRDPHRLVKPGEAAIEWNLLPEKADNIIAEETGKRLVRISAGIIHTDSLSLYRHEIIRNLTRFHEENAMRTGMSLLEVRNSVRSYFNPDILNGVIEELINSKEICRDGDNIRLPGFKPRLSEKEVDIAERVARRFTDKGTRYQPPSDRELEQEYGREFRTVWKYLSETGRIVKTAPGIWFSSDVLDDIKVLIREHIIANGDIDVKTLRTLLDTSRKYSIAILEYFDASGFTVRRGDVRVLRE